MKKCDVKIGIVGGGNIGKVLSTMLCSLGYDVELVCRDNHRAIKIDNSYAFSIKGDFGDKEFLVPYVNSISNLSSKKDIIIFATKSYDMLNRVCECLPKLTSKGMIVTIQNVYTIDKLFHLIPPEASVCMICDFASVSYKKVTHVRDSHGVTLGVYNRKAVNRMKLLARILSDFMKVHITKDIIGFTMGRNIINGAISLLGGISGLRLKDILKSYKGRKLFCKIIEESYNVCRRHRLNVMPYNQQLDYERFIGKGIKNYFYRHKIIKCLIRNNGHIKSSALDDLEHGSKTEIRCLIDTIISYGHKTNTNIKYLTCLSEILENIEQGKMTINKNIFNRISLQKNVKNLLI